MPRTQAPENSYRAAQFASQNVVVRPVQLKLPAAHTKQYELITILDRNPNLRYVVGACGTKFGKTWGCTIALVKHAWEHPNSLNWWVAPTYAQSKNAYSLVLRLLPKGTYKEYKADMRVELLRPDDTTHSVIEFKSGDNPDSLRGFGVDYFIMDEAARCPYDSFVSVVTTTTQTLGKGLIISTPKGRGWFYDVYQRGEKLDREGNKIYDDPKDDPWPEWYSIRMPTWANPTVTQKAIEQFKRNFPEDVFRQEVAAEFLLESAGVFRGIKACVRGVFAEPHPQLRYVMGVDLASLRDFSVLTVMDTKNRHVVYHERFKEPSWDVQYHRIIEVAKRYNRATVIIDSTGLGDPIVQTIGASELLVEPYKFGGSAAKKQVIDKLRINIENQRISFPNIPILIRELENYEYKISDGGVIKFSAPSGFHDDCVISLALANWGADRDPWVYKYSNIRGI